MTEGWVDYLTGPWGFAFAFAAGILSFLSPCVLPLVPAYLAHLTGTAAVEEGADARRQTVLHASIFVLGFAAVFTFIGASVGLLSALFGGENGYWIRDHEDTLAKIGGVFLIILGLNLIGVIRIPWLYRSYTLESMAARPSVVSVSSGGAATMTMGGGGGGSGAGFQPGQANPGAGFQPGRSASGLQYLKSAGVGATFAVGWTPCIGPVLGAIFSLALVSSSVAKGAFLLAVYSLGLGVPFIITGLAVVPVTAFLRRFRRVMPIVEIVTGVLVVFVGALIFLDELTIFNTYFDFFGLSEI